MPRCGTDQLSKDVYTIKMTYKSGTATAKLEHSCNLTDFVQTLTTINHGKDWELDKHISQTLTVVVTLTF